MHYTLISHPLALQKGDHCLSLLKKAIIAQLSEPLRHSRSQQMTQKQVTQM